VTYLVALVALLFGLVVGEKFPDVDQRTNLLLHRSIITHGLLMPLLLYAAASRTQWAPFRWFSMGVSLGVAVHLSFDLFPRAWSGFALVSIPVYGWLPAVVSWVWIAVSGVTCVYLAGKLARNIGESGLFMLGLAGIFVYAAPGEHALWRPMAAATLSLLAASFALVVTSRPTDWKT
jgi:hypothetical protein